MIKRKIKNTIIVHKQRLSAFILLLIGFFLSVSLYTFNPYDQSWFYFDSSTTTTTNFFGSIGANTAALLFYFFGMSSFLILGFIFYSAYILINQITIKSEWERLIALLLLPYICATLCNIYNIDYFNSIFPGGTIGNGLKIVTAGWFDISTSTLFFFTLLSISIILIFRNTIMHILYGSKIAFDFFSSKQRFLKPTYTISKKIIYIASIPFVFSFQFCKKLLKGEDVTENDQSIISFEQYILDQEHKENIETLSNWGRQNKTKNSKFNCEKGECAQQAIWKEKTELETNDSVKKNPITIKPYRLPDQNLFVDINPEKNKKKQTNQLENSSKILEEKLEKFGVFGKVISIKKGPVITLFEYQPKVDSKISKIVSLADDLAMALQALSIRIIAPIPGRSVVGFEVANKKRDDVLFSSIVKSKNFKNFSGSIPLILGKDTVGNNVIVDLATMPHLLIAGSTGSGKSVALNSLLISMLCKLKPNELNLILVDPKRLEFSTYEDISHLLFPIVTDPKKVSPILKWVVQHMEERYEKMAQIGSRNIFDYNKQADEKLPFMVIVVDELADLMMTAGKDIEGLIARIAQMARAAGIHMILATQRPSVDVITGLIKVNFPSRISFRVTSKVDSRTILDCCGAEKLLGRGDMLFLGSGSSMLKRLHGSYVSDQDIDRVVNHIKSEKKVSYRDLSEYIKIEDAQLSDADDKLYSDVLFFLDSIDEVSISLLQRKFRIGYNRSARIIEKLEAQGIILPSEGGKTRKVVR